jgi:hypothetical protein
LNIVSLHHRVHLQDEGQVTSLIAVHAADVLCGIHEHHPLFETGRLDQVAIERAGLGNRQAAWMALVHEAMSE